ncbi:hypothetical protein OG760_12035 [Streptomyces sp. NBC_00963]|uniref:hypothetical protein n=1 Tax=unclassified Streptomyces TaxID=2593676 RepID=UPI0022543E5C|nr:hypothetical protein [Streptomyces sp. NBC_01306]MCX4726363.1 hypothetical protein [Streptomyces sp. NBC_01306]WSX42373.1 hypothetical protein OG760_12035 [Streptomyces sp. NBC_00963]
MSEFDIVDQYDSIDDPGQKSDLLDTVGLTRPVINSLRRRRASARRTAEAAPTPPENNRPTTPPPDGAAPRSSRPPRGPRRPRVTANTRPPNRSYALRRYRRTRPAVVIVLILKFD